jgi:hypothetical protein
MINYLLLCENCLRRDKIYQTVISDVIPVSAETGTVSHSAVYHDLMAYPRRDLKFTSTFLNNKYRLCLQSFIYTNIMTSFCRDQSNTNA